MAEQSNNTQEKINTEDRHIAARPENRNSHECDRFNQGSNSMPSGANAAEGIFGNDGEGVTGEALGGGPLGTGNTGAELPAGAQSEFARTSGGQTGGYEPDNEYGAQYAKEPAGGDHQHSALGGSVVAAGGNSTSPGPGQTGFNPSKANTDEE